MQVHLMPYVVVGGGFEGRARGKGGDGRTRRREGEGNEGNREGGETTEDDNKGVLIGEALLRGDDFKQYGGPRRGRMTNEEAAAAWLVLYDTVVKMRGMRSGMEFDVFRGARAIAGGKILKV